MQQLTIAFTLFALGSAAAQAQDAPYLELTEPGVLAYGYDFTPTSPGVASNVQVDQRTSGTAYVRGISANNNFWASATMAPQGLYLPELKLYAEAHGSPDRTYTEVFALALQHYTYTGTTSTSYTLRLTLDGIYQGTNGSVGAELSAGLYYLDDSEEGGLVVDYAAIPPIDLSIGADSISDSHYTLTKDMQFTLTPGGGIDLLSRLTASAIPGRNGWSIQDVSHTYSMQLVSGDASLLVAAISPVPEPSRWLLLAAGLAVVGLRRPRRGSAAESRIRPMAHSHHLCAGSPSLPHTPPASAAGVCHGRVVRPGREVRAPDRH